MNQSKFESLHRGQTGIAKKVYEAVPIQTAMSAPEVTAEMRRLGSNADLRVVAGCLCTLLDSGLIQERPKGWFIRTPVRIAEPIAIPPQPEPMKTTALRIATTTPASPIERLTAISKRVTAAMDELKAIADDIETAAIEITEQGERAEAKSQKLQQLQELLKSLGT